MAKSPFPKKSEDPVKQSDIDAMSVKDMMELQPKLAEAIIERKAQEKTEIKAKLAALAEKSGFSLDELFRKARKNGNGSKVAPKYRNPADSAQTWTGRGRMPLWIKAHADKGTKLDKFLIK
jgi:DNA-binding protein H-NS